MSQPRSSKRPPPSPAAALGLILTLASASAPSAAQKSDPVAQALTLIPEVAAVRLGDALEQAQDTSARARITLALAEALLRAGRPADALARLPQDPVPEQTTACYWRAQALLALGLAEDALAAYRKADPGGDAFPGPETRLGQARALVSLGRKGEALPLLEPLNDDPRLGPRARLLRAEVLADLGRRAEAMSALAGMAGASRSQERERLYIEARILLANGEHAAATARFAELARRPQHLSEPMWAGVHLGWAEALRQGGAFAEAEQVLKDFVARNPENAFLARAFDLLDKVQQAQPTGGRGELDTWAREAGGARRDWARLQLARIEAREGRADDALRALAQLGAEPTAPDVVQAALLEAGRLLVDTGRLREGIERFTAARAGAADRTLLAWIDHAGADAAARLGEFQVASAGYLRAATQSPALAERALYNAALMLAGSGSYDGFLRQYSAFSAQFPESDLRPDLVLERALLQARTGDAGARETLEMFARDFPDSPRLAEAEVALAELAFAQSPPDLTRARQWLERARAGDHPLDPPLAERADYLEIWIADAADPRDKNTAIALGRRFIETHPASRLLPEARLKLGELFQAAGDYADAEMTFAQLTRDTPTSPLVERALYLAGECALKSMDPAGFDRAVGLFEDVFEMGGALRLVARLKQAEAKGLQGQPTEAIALYDDLLKMAREGPIHLAALAGKGEALHLLGAADPAQYPRAVELFEQVAASPDVTPIWRNQAFFLAGRTLEKMGERARALASYHRVLEQKDDPGVEPEYYWYYRAGFAAAGLLEADRRWESAVRVYSALADSDGPRAAEAGMRLKELRLQHFLWEE